MEDQEIVELFLQRNEDAVKYTEQKYTTYCFTIAKQILNSHEDSEESVNETWFAAWNSIPPHIPECLRTFLGKITRNICLKKIRSANAIKRGSQEYALVYEEIEQWLVSSENVEDDFEMKELSEIINKFLESISETERNIFVRRYWYMKSISEIAKYHQFSESKVKSLLYRIRKKLYKELKKENYV